MFSADWRAWLASSAHAHQWLLHLLEHWNKVLFPGIITTTLGLAGIWIGLRDKPNESAPKPVPLPDVMVPVALRSQGSDGTAPALSAPRGEGEREPTRETTIFYTLIGAIAFWASLAPRLVSTPRSTTPSRSSRSCAHPRASGSWWRSPSPC